MLHALAFVVRFARLNKNALEGRVGGVEHQLLVYTGELLVYTGFTELSGKYSKLSPKQKNFLRRSTFYGEIRMVSKAFATHFLMIKW